MNDFFSADKTILVTGSNGQLGMELQQLAPQFPSCEFFFTTKADLPIDNFSLVKKYFEERQIDYCINCAAYTAVDKAETETEKAFLINADAAGNLARLCKEHGATLIHISTDYVFDGQSSISYTEDSAIAPINQYGASKLKGEELVLNNYPLSIIIRTSWVYSFYGHNFIKIMLRLMHEKQSINVVSDQYGSPTYAADLANVIMKIVKTENNKTTGIFNYCNAGVISWYNFATEIKKIIKSRCVINPITTSEYPTPARRPYYSVLDTSKIKNTFGITIPKWKDSLKKCLALLQEK